MGQETAAVVLINKAKQEIIDTINRQGIAPSVMRLILYEVYDLVCKAAEEEYKNAIPNQNGVSEEVDGHG